MKLAQLQELNPDVVFIQEARKPTNDLAPSQIWRGANEKQGVAAFGFNGHRVISCEVLDGTHPVTLPFIVQGKIDMFVLGIWAKQDPTYVKCIWKMIDLYQGHLSEKEAVILGDFNSNVIWDKNNRSCSHSMLVDRLKTDFGMVSSYHAYHDLDQGTEADPTIYWMYNKDRPYHIDYCFIPDRWLPNLRGVSVGEYEPYKKLSDHRPLVVDIHTPSS